MFKKIIPFFIILIIINNKIIGQSLFENNPDYFLLEENIKSGSTSYLPYGGCFTPKGDLRVLIIFASFGDPYDQQYVNGWSNTSTFPDWAVASKKPFYSTVKDFLKSSLDSNNHSVSKFYYDMSNPNNKFRLFVDYYPSRVLIDATSCNSWGETNQKVIQKISTSNPTFSWAPYDKRINSPNFQNDYSGVNPDLKPDFIVICYRFDHSWANLPASNMNNWYECGPCGGFSDLAISNIASNGYTVTHTGFTHVTGASNPTWMFLHETGHSLYNAPHYNGNNNVTGDYFYEPNAGWGMMSLNTFTSALGWERWILDWVPNITANGINSDIKTSSDLNSNGIYTLRDFITTGDMLRIKIPNGTSQNQYLWIENHQGKSVFDYNFNAPTFCDATVPFPPRGIVAYIEAINDNKNYVNNFDQGNAIRFLNADGNYDLIFNPTPLYPTLAYCNNVTYNFTKGEANPIGGQNLGERIRNDFNNDGVITYNTGDNSAQNEQSPVVVYNGYTSADYFLGKNSGFSIGQKAGISENPCIINVPKYNPANGGIPPNGMSSYYLNGISFKLLSIDQDGNITIQIKLNDVEINKDTRWAASSIKLCDITNDPNPDIDVLQGITVNIDKSGTPNRHTKTSQGDFINPTIFSCNSNSFFRMKTNSKVNVINSSTLILETGSTFEINDASILKIGNGGTLQIKNGSNLIIKGTGKVEIEDGAFICIEDGAIINLQDYLSSINLRNGYQVGLNPSIIGLTGNCNNSPASFNKTGLGSINTFNNNQYIQNQIFTNNLFIPAFNIYIGSNVTDSKPQGPVIIQDGSKIVFDGEGNIIINNFFEVKPNSSFELK